MAAADDRGSRDGAPGGGAGGLLQPALAHRGMAPNSQKRLPGGGASTPNRRTAQAGHCPGRGAGLAYPVAGLARSASSRVALRHLFRPLGSEGSGSSATTKKSRPRGHTRQRKTAPCVGGGGYAGGPTGRLSGQRFRSSSRSRMSLERNEPTLWNGRRLSIS